MRLAERSLWLGAAVGAGLAGAWALWPTDVPSDLALPPLEQGDVALERHLARAERFETFVHWNGVAAIVAVLVVLVLYAWRGDRLARESAAGPIGTGMLLGMLGLGILWLTQIPFGLAEVWWARRYGTLEVGYLEWLLEYWLALAGEFGFVSLALLIVMGFARVLRDNWWVAGAPAFVALYVVFAWSLPWLIPDDRPLDDRRLAAIAREYARDQGIEPVPIRIEEVSDYTDSPNAFAAGLGESRKIFLWDTLLDGRFADSEVRTVVAHELAHHSREHIWKSVAWYALLAFPGTFLIALVARRRGGLREPRAVPLALLAFVALNLAAQPFVNAVGRRLEAEADWVALETTEDPRAARELFERFTTVVLADPDPPRWTTLLFSTHPTLLDRARMAEAWRLRAQGRSHP